MGATTAELAMLGWAGLGLLGLLSEQRVGSVERVVLGLGFWVIAVGLEGSRRGDGRD